MRSKLKIAFLLFSYSLFSALQGCDPSKKCSLPAPSANTFFIIKEHGQILSDTSVLSKLNLYYLDKYGDKISNPNQVDPGSYTIYDQTKLLYPAYDYYSKDPEFKGTDIMVMSELLPYVSFDKKIHTFYLTFPNNDIDTITLISDSASCQQAWKDPCECELPVRILKFNGQLVSEDTSYHLMIYQPVYVFNK